jgi:ribosome-binding factor A
MGSRFNTKHIHLNGATPVGKLCVSAVKMSCDLHTASLKLLAFFEPLGRKCATLKRSKEMIWKNLKKN